MVTWTHYFGAYDEAWGPSWSLPTTLQFSSLTGKEECDHLLNEGKV
jgi:hypothetical protein